MCFFFFQVNEYWPITLNFAFIPVVFYADVGLYWSTQLSYFRTFLSLIKRNTGSFFTRVLNRSLNKTNGSRYKFAWFICPLFSYLKYVYFSFPTVSCENNNTFLQIGKVRFSEEPLPS